MNSPNVPILSRSRPTGSMWQQAILITIVMVAFFSGSVVGFAYNSRIISQQMIEIVGNPEAHRQQAFEKITQQLALKDKQKIKVRQIVKIHFQNTENIRRQSLPEIKAELARFQQEVSDQLDRSQKESWAKTCNWVRVHCYGITD